MTKDELIKKTLGKLDAIEAKRIRLGKMKQGYWIGMNSPKWKLGTYEKEFEMSVRCYEQVKTNIKKSIYKMET